MLIRAQDILSIPALVHYARLTAKNSPDVSQGVNAVIVSFAEWQAENPDLVKLPD